MRYVLGIAYLVVVATSPLSAQQVTLRTTFDGKGMLQADSVAFSPDRKVLATGHRDDVVRLWDVATGKLKATLKGHEHAVSSVAFSGDGKLLASASADLTVKLWDVTTGKEKATFKGHTRGGVLAVSFSGDGKLLASVGFDGLLKVWDVATGKEKSSNELWTLGSAGQVAFSGDGKLVAAMIAKSMVKVWDVATGKERASLKVHEDAAFHVALSGDGKLLASASGRFVHGNRGDVMGSVTLWDVTTGKEKATCKGLTNYVDSLAFSLDGKLLAAGTHKMLNVWDVATGKERAALKIDTNGFSVSFSGDGKQLASGGGYIEGPAEVKLWDIPVAKKADR